MGGGGRWFSIVSIVFVGLGRCRLVSFIVVVVFDCFIRFL